MMGTKNNDVDHTKNQLPLNSFIEHTLLKDGLTEADIVLHLGEAKSLNVFAVCVPLAWVAFAKRELLDTAIKVVTVIDFPKGNASLSEKILEVHAAKAFGADEIDMVLDYQALINKDYQLVLDGILAVINEAKPLIVKVIVETSALNHAQLAIACALVAMAKADFIKTSTGFHTAGAQIKDILLMRSLLPQKIGIKASGGIKNQEEALAFVHAGATRIGSSKSRYILTGS